MQRINPAPRDQMGRFVSTLCPHCGNGTLRFVGDDFKEGKQVFTCDGLDDPQHPDKALELCNFEHVSGELATASLLTKSKI